MKTTAIGVITIIVAVCNAVLAFLKTGSFDFAVTATAVTSGWGLIKAHDAPPPVSGETRCDAFAVLAAVGLALCCVSCVTTTGKDGAVTRKVDDAAVKPWRDLARELVLSLFKKDPPPAIEPAPVPEVLPTK